MHDRSHLPMHTLMPAHMHACTHAHAHAHAPKNEAACRVVNHTSHACSPPGPPPRPSHLLPLLYCPRGDICEGRGCGGELASWRPRVLEHRVAAGGAQTVLGLWCGSSRKGGGSHVEAVAGRRGQPRGCGSIVWQGGSSRKGGAQPCGKGPMLWQGEVMLSKS